MVVLLRKGLTGKGGEIKTVSIERTGAEKLGEQLVQPGWLA